MACAGGAAPNPSEKDSFPVISTSEFPGCQDGRVSVVRGAEAPVQRGPRDPAVNGAPTDANSGARGAAQTILKNAPTRKGAKKKDRRKTHPAPPRELESQFLLRLPAEQAATVRKLLYSGKTDMKDKLKIDLCPDERRAVVKVEGDVLSAKLVDLPCVIESLKTSDKKNFYKTADISQMLVCGADPAPDKPDPLTDPMAVKESEEEGQKNCSWNHGIAPPLKNVRKRRFRKTKKNADCQQDEEFHLTEFTQCPEVDKELKRLLRSDAEAVSVRWETVEDGTKETESQGSVPSYDISSEMIAHKQAQVFVPVVEIQKQIDYVEKQLKEIQIKAKRQEDLIKNVENPTLQSHFQRVLGKLEIEETERNEELIFLQEQMKRAGKVKKPRAGT